MQQTQGGTLSDADMLLAAYTDLAPWGSRPGEPFWKGSGLEQATKIALDHLGEEAKLKGVARSAAAAIANAANYGRNFNDNRCAELLGYPSKSRHVKKLASSSDLRRTASWT